MALDAALVTASDKSLKPVLEALRSGARIAYPNGVEPEPKAPQGVQAEGYDGEPTPERLKRLNRLIEEAPFHVHIDARYRLDQAAEAHRAVERHHLGKIALKIAPLAAAHEGAHDELTRPQAEPTIVDADPNYSQAQADSAGSPGRIFLRSIESENATTKPAQPKGLRIV